LYGTTGPGTGTFATNRARSWGQKHSKSDNREKQIVGLFGLKTLLISHPYSWSPHMADLKNKVTSGIDKAADKAKNAAKKTVDKGKEAATAAGNKVKEAGQKMKDAGN